jgi:hypothetical protein
MVEHWEEVSGALLRIHHALSEVTYNQTTFQHIAEALAEFVERTGEDCPVCQARCSSVVNVTPNIEEHPVVMLRGESWTGRGEFFRLTHRNYYRASGKYPYDGFRIARRKT